MSKKTRPSVRGQTGAEIHARGSITKGPATPEMVENRARELALIAGREPNRVTASDRIQAKKELLGDDSGDAAADDTGITEAQTVEEGLNEAEHDKMLHAAKTRTKSQG